MAGADGSFCFRRDRGPAWQVEAEPKSARPTRLRPDNRGNKVMTHLIKKIRGDNSGASAAEYALIIALIGLAILVGARALGTAINTNFISAATTINP